MVQTLTTGSAAYCTAAQFLERYDVRTLADLLSDDGIALLVASVATNAKLLNILKEASGKLEAACFAGERYSAADLAAISSGNQGQFIAGIVANIAIATIYRRRPDVTMPVMPQIEETENILNALANGTRIFGFQETSDAGHADSDNEVPADVEARNLVTYQARRMFGTRSNRTGRYSSDRLGG